MTEYYGKYRGKVEVNVDPKRRGRVMVSVPSVTGAGKLNWALPCVPFAGKSVGLWAIPPKGANVWVEYEGGDPDHPIWTGCFWEKGEVPADPAVAQIVMLKTPKCTLTMSDVPGKEGITIEASGMKISLASAGLEITNGSGASIELKGKGVRVNKDALEVT